MKIYRILSVLITFTFIFIVLSCNSDDGGGGNTQNSSDVLYANVSILSANVNDAAADELAPEISSNGLELYFQSTRGGGSGAADLWVSTRNTAIDNWGVATNLGATVNSVTQDTAATISNDGLALIFASDRIGGLGGFDLYMITRPTLNSIWSAPVNLGGVINTQFSERGPEISTDGLSLYFFSGVPGGFGATDLYVSSRASILDPWEPSINLGGNVNSLEFDGGPEIASDGLSFYFHSGRPGGPGARNIWRTTRESVNDSWATPEVLPMPINSTSVEFAPSLSDDWQTLYFTSDVGGNRDIWQAVP